MGCCRIAFQRLLFELEFDELFELLLDELLEERRVGWSGAMPTARAARFMPFSHPRKKLCTAVSPRGLLRLLLELLLFDELLEEFELLLLDELLDEFELLLLEELLDELLEELDEEFEDELELLLLEELELPLLDEFELLLPALILSGFTLSSTSWAIREKCLADGRLCAWAPEPPTTPATAVTITPSCCFMGILLRCWGCTSRWWP
mgnify:CR=1 FL=1